MAKYRRRRRTRRKKVFRRKRMRGAGKRYDGTTYMKLTVQKDVQQSAAAGHAFVDCYWVSQNPAAIIANNVYMNDGTEFASRMQNKVWFRVNGMKIVYTPFYYQSANDTSLVACSTASTINNDLVIGDGVNIMSTKPDYKSHMPNRPFKRYYHVGKFMRSINHNWKDPQGAGPLYPQGDQFTRVMIENNGFANLASIGRISVTWYVAAKGFHS